MQIIKTEVKETAANVYYDVTIRVSATDYLGGPPSSSQSADLLRKKIGEMVDSAVKSLVAR